MRLAFGRQLCLVLLQAHCDAAAPGLNTFAQLLDIRTTRAGLVLVFGRAAKSAVPALTCPQYPATAGPPCKSLVYRRVCIATAIWWLSGRWRESLTWPEAESINFRRADRFGPSISN
jgi:hypothetical protein